MKHQSDITINGSYGEGGGQILRTSLSLSSVTGQPVVLEQIRAGRSRPGLQAQHLAAVKAAAAICAAKLDGAEIGSQRLRFAPQSPTVPGTYHFAMALLHKSFFVVADAVGVVFLACEQQEHPTLSRLAKAEEASCASQRPKV